MSKYFSSNKSIIALVIALIVSLLVYFNNESSIIRFLQNYWTDLKIYITKPKSQLEDFMSNRERLNQIKLEEIKFKLNYKQQEPYIKYLESIVESQGIKNLKQRFSEQDSSVFILANVLWHNNPQISNSISINMGLRDFPEYFKKKNFIVVDEMGNLVGRLTDIGDKSSLVQLINDVNNKIILEKKHNSDDFTALMVPISYNKSKLLGVSLNDSIEIGDTLFTSYKSDVYIDRIPVCKVISVSPSQAFRNVIVQNLANLNYINNVVLIGVDFE